MQHGFTNCRVKDSGLIFTVRRFSLQNKELTLRWIAVKEMVLCLQLPTVFLCGEHFNRTDYEYLYCSEKNEWYFIYFLRYHWVVYWYSAFKRLLSNKERCYIYTIGLCVANRVIRCYYITAKFQLASSSMNC